MNCREYAKSRGVVVVGKLKRMPDRYYGVRNDHYPWYLDEAGNEFLMDRRDGKMVCGCIVLSNGGVV